MGKAIRTVLLLTIFQLGCGKAVSPEQLLGITPTPADPSVTSISYLQDGAVQLISAPITEWQLLRPDLGSSVCTSPLTEITINGNYDANIAKTFQITGVASHKLTQNNGLFQIVSCIALGSAAVTIKTLSEKSVANKVPLNLSLNIRAFMTTIGAGNPAYPKPGFRTLNSTVPAVSRTSGNISLTNFSTGDTGNKTVTNSTGSVALSMSLGFVNILHEARPQD